MLVSRAELLAMNRKFKELQRPETKGNRCTFSKALCAKSEYWKGGVMDIQTKEALIAEIERFKEEALKMHIVQVLADSYTNTNLFDYNIDSDGSVIWYKAQARQLWDFWQAESPSGA